MYFVLIKSGYLWTNHFWTFNGICCINWPFCWCRFLWATMDYGAKNRAVSKVRPSCQLIRYNICLELHLHSLYDEYYFSIWICVQVKYGVVVVKYLFKQSSKWCHLIDFPLLRAFKTRADLMMVHCGVSQRAEVGFEHIPLRPQRWLQAQDVLEGPVHRRGGRWASHLPPGLRSVRRTVKQRLSGTMNIFCQRRQNGTVSTSDGICHPILAVSLYPFIICTHLYLNTWREVF